MGVNLEDSRARAVGRVYYLGDLSPALACIHVSGVRVDSNELLRW